MVSNKNYKVKGAALVLFVTVIALSASAYARTESKYPEFKADCKVEIIGEPKLGEPFEVVFTFTPLDSFSHSRGIPDYAYIGSDSGVEFLGGDTLWTGFLQTGQQYVLRGKYMVKSEIRFDFIGVVYAMQVLGIIMPSTYDQNKGIDFGIKAYSVTKSQAVDFRSEVEKQKRKQQKISAFMVTDTGLVPMESSLVSPPPEFARRPVITEVTDSQLPRRKKGKLRTWDEAIQQTIHKADLPIKLDSSVPDTIKITYDSGRACVFVTDTSVISIEVELLDGKGEYEKIEEKKGAFQLESDSAIFIIRAGGLERVLIVKTALPATYHR